MQKKYFLKSKICFVILAMALLLSYAKTNAKPEADQPRINVDVKSPTTLPPVEINTSTELKSGFEDGSITPFNVCTTKHPNYGQAHTLGTTKAMKFYWAENNFQGERISKGAEACSSLNFYKEGWYGFQFYLPKPGYPIDKETAIAQIFAEHGCHSWAAALIVRNNALYLKHRNACIAPTEVLIVDDIERNAWKAVIIHFKASKTGNGLMEVWYDGAKKSTPTYSVANINFAWGAWNGDSLDPTVSDNMIKLKFGMYSYDAANYSANETRTIYFDNVNQLVDNPVNAWETVNPDQ